MPNILLIPLLWLAMGFALTSAAPPATAPAAQESADTIPEAFDIIRQILGEPASAKDDLLSFVFPRTDLEVLMDGYLVPVEAGLRTEVHFFKCPCGRMLLSGTFCLAEWEVNDVIDELRKANIKVVSTASGFQRSKPQMIFLRFQAEGHEKQLAEAIKASFEWIGEARNAHPKLESLIPKDE